MTRKNKIIPAVEQSSLRDRLKLPDKIPPKLWELWRSRKIKLKTNPEVEQGSLLGRNKLLFIKTKLEENKNMIIKNKNKIIHLTPILSLLRRGRIFKTLKKVSVAVFILVITLGQLISPSVVEAVTSSYTQSSFAGEANTSTTVTYPSTTTDFYSSSNITAGTDLQLTSNTTMYSLKQTNDSSEVSSPTSTVDGSEPNHKGGFNTLNTIKSDTMVNGFSDGAKVQTLVTSAQITTGAYYTCALKTDGTVYCWGDNTYGQLGQNNTTQYTTPVQVLKGASTGDTTYLGDGTVKISQIIAGSNHTCALKTDGSMVCWGYNGYGQLGQNNTIIQYNTPVQVLKGASAGDTTYLGDGAVKVSQIIAGFRHTCALKTDGTVYCWGGNGSGQLGQNNTIQYNTPVQVNDVYVPTYINNVSQISTGADHSCAIKTDDTVYCWGYNNSGQLGQNNTNSYTTPVQVLKGASTGDTTYLGDGAVKVSQIIASNGYTCAVKTDGSAYCWGANTNGVLGDGTTTQRTTPTQVSGLTSGVTAVTAEGYSGGYHTCAVKTDGSALCWGLNNYGQLGDGTTTNRTTPTQVSGLTSGVTAISAGGSSTCALKSDGSVVCWGDNVLTPTQVSGLTSGVTAIANGYSHTCALKSDGSVVCWGYNGSGRLGDGTTTNRTTPTQVSGLTSGVTAIASGYNHTCAVKTDGSLVCWGGNDYGQLGDGTTTNRTTPTQVSGLTSGVTAITLAGSVWSNASSHTCALKTDGSAYCWGNNILGQLGQSNTTQYNTPVQVHDVYVPTYINFGNTSYTTSGTYTSYIDSGAVILLWNTFGFTKGSSSGANTGKISIKIKSGTSNSSAPADIGSASGNCSIDNITTDGAFTPRDISICAGSSQYLWYQATLDVNGDTTKSPTLNDVTASVNSTIYQTSGNLISSPYDTTQSGNIITSLSWIEDASLPSGTTATVSLRTASTSGGLTGAWSDFTNACGKVGSTVTCATNSIPAGLKDGLNDEWVQYKVALTSGGTNSPTVDDVTINYGAAPAAPSTPDLALEDDTGISSTDNITTNTTALTFNGTAETDSSVQLYDDGVSVGSPVTATGGNWSIDLSLTAGSAHTITAKATDVMGTSVASSELIVIVDTTAPTSSITTLCSVEGNGCTPAGASASPQQAYRVQTISGGAADTDGSGVNVVDISIKDTNTNLWYNGTSFVDSSETYLPATGTTTWSYNSSSISFVLDHTYLIHAKATDEAGNEQTAIALSFIFVNSPPTVSNVTASEDSSGVVNVSYDVTDIESSQTTNSLFYKDASSLSGTITSDASSLIVSDGTYLPSAGTIMIDDEMISYSSKSGTTLSGLTRGADSTTPSAHNTGADIFVKATSASGTGIGLSNIGTGKIISWTARNDVNGFETASGVIKVVANDGAAALMIGSMASSSFILDTANPVGTLVLDVNAGTATLTGTDLSSITYLLQNGSTVTSGTAASVGANAWTFGSETNKTVTALLTDAYGNQTSVTAVAPAMPTSFQVKDITNLPAGVYGEALSWTKVTDVASSTAVSYEIWKATDTGVATLLTTINAVDNTYSDVTVLSNHTYTYKVRALDTDGDYSAFSATQSITPSGVAISSVVSGTPTATGVTITWTTDLFSNSVVNYGTTTNYGSSTTGTDGNTKSHTVTLTDLTPATLYYFKVQSTDGSGNTSTNDNDGAGYTFTTASAVNIIATAGANGTITPSGVTAVQSGTDQTYTITPSDGYQVATLTIDGEVVTSATTYIFTNVIATHTIDATFALNTYDITATAGDNGAISPSGVTSVQYGTDQAYTITPDEGYIVASLIVDGISLASAESYTFTNVVASHTIAVTFTNVPFGTIGFNSAINQESEDVGIANIPVSLSSAYPTDVTVDYTVTPGTALGSGTDYTLISGTLTISAGETTANIVVVIADDSIFEQTETFTVTLSNPVNATLGTNTVNTFSILDNDIVVTHTDSTVKATSATITWTTASYANSLVEYGTIDPGSDPATPTSGAYSLSKTNADLVLDHSIYLGNLTPSTTYYARTTSTDADNVSTVATSTFTTTAGPVISAVGSSGVTDTVAVISWTTDLPATSYVNYSTDSGLASPSRFGTSDLVTEHSVTLTGLSSGSTYYYSVDGTDADSNESEDANDGSYYNFITGADQTPPIISEPTTPVITDTQVAITWDTNENATSQVQYGTVSGVYDQTTTLISLLLKSHLVAIDSLTARTTYYYVVVSTDANGNSATSSEKTFETVPSAPKGGTMGVAQDIYDALLAQNKAYSSKFGSDTSVPVVSNIQVDGITPFGATISFETSKDTIVFIDYGKNTSYGSQVSDSKWAKVHTIVLSGLSLGTEYNFKITAMDLLNNLGYSENQTFTTKFLTENFSDLQKVDNIEQFQKEIESTIQSILPSLIPPFIDTPVVTDITENSATINFRTNVKSFPIVDYVTDGNYDSTKDDPYDGEISDVTKKTTNHTLILNNLRSNTKYHVMAKAFSLPQVIGKSDDFTFTTSASKIQASILGIKNDSFTVVWSTDEPTSSIVEYKDTKSGITKRFVDSASDSSHSINITGLTPGTSYEVSVSGIDAKGNTIESNAPVKVVTLVDVVPPIISNLKVNSSLIIGLADKVQTIISWQTDEPATSVINYAEGSGSINAPLNNKQEKLEYTLNHVVILTSLKAGTVYRFTLESTDEAGNTMKPPVRTIVTPQQTASIMDIIFKNFDDTFKFINNVR